MAWFRGPYRVMVAFILAFALFQLWQVRAAFMRPWHGVSACQVLDDRVCADLGAAGCQIWTERLKKAGSGSAIPLASMGWRNGDERWLYRLLKGKELPNYPVCEAQLDPQNYPTSLASIRAMVAAAPTRP